MFQENDADRTLNIIESILISEAMRDATYNKSITKARTEFLSMYNAESNYRDGGDSGPVFDIPEDMSDWGTADSGLYGEPAPPMPGGKHNPNKPRYIQPTDGGYPGLEPPVG